MKNHLLLYLTNKFITYLLVNNDNQIVETNQIFYQDIFVALKEIIKILDKDKIDRIIVLPELASIKENFFSLSIGETDSFNYSLIRKLEQSNISTQDTILNYKIISETSNDKLDYIISLLIIPSNFYKNFSKIINKIKPSNLVQWIPINYCLAGTILSAKNEQPLTIHVTSKQTNLIVQQEKELITISSIPFSVSQLKKALSEDGLSDNQIQNKLSMGLVLKESLGFHTKQLITQALEDLQKEIHFICSTYKISINTALLIAEQLQKSDLVDMINDKIDIPCAVSALPDNGLKTDLLNSVQEKRLMNVAASALDKVKNMELFLTYTPQKNGNNEAPIKKKTISKDIVVFFSLLLIIVTGSLYLNSNLYKSMQLAKTALYGTKNQLTRTKAQYIEVSESLYTQKQINDTIARIYDLEKKNTKLQKMTSVIMRQLSNNLQLQHTKLTIKDSKILIYGQVPKQATIYSYIDSLSKNELTQKVILKRLQPGTPMKFVLEVQL